MLWTRVSHRQKKLLASFAFGALGVARRIEAEDAGSASHPAKNNLTTVSESSTAVVAAATRADSDSAKGKFMSEAEANNGRWLSKSDIARLLKVHCRTIDRLREAGDFPPPVYLTSRTIRWKQDVIDQFLTEKRGAA
jgi:predicted DNA-binding transcriptional regulator AlpA